MSCTSGCVTQDHSSYAECLKAKAPKVAYCNSAGGMDYSTQKRWDKDLAAYRDAKAQGVQPASTRRGDVERAIRISNESGQAWRA